TDAGRRSRELQRSTDEGRQVAHQDHADGADSALVVHVRAATTGDGDGRSRRTVAGWGRAGFHRPVPLQLAGAHSELDPTNPILSPELLRERRRLGPRYWYALRTAVSERTHVQAHDDHRPPCRPPREEVCERAGDISVEAR